VEGQKKGLKGGKNVKSRFGRGETHRRKRSEARDSGARRVTYDRKIRKKNSGDLLALQEEKRT